MLFQIFKCKTAYIAIGYEKLFVGQRMASAFLGLPAREVIVQLFVQFLTSTRGKLEGSAVADKANHIPCAVKNGAAVSAVFEVRGQDSSKARINFVVEII
ncbi:MAG TPA: hypothetical protein VGV15_09290 [Terriglobales bacterium]|nr:hypothetical protein [Terriglobales bacterium]